MKKMKKAINLGLISLTPVIIAGAGLMSADTSVVVQKNVNIEEKNDFSLFSPENFEKELKQEYKEFIDKYKDLGEVDFNKLSEEEKNKITDFKIRLYGYLGIPIQIDKV
ncbi:hypothetical protein ACW95P_00545 [Candidatus Mycoplasma pogonae]